MVGGAPTKGKDMSRTGLYWTDDRDRLCCAHGVILYGNRCVQCERGDLPKPRSFIADAVRTAMAGKFHDGGFIPKSLRATGFDTASGPDRTATGTYQRVGDTMRFTVDDLKSEYVMSNDRAREAREAINGNDEQMAKIKRRADEMLRRMYTPFITDPPYHWEHRADPRPRDHHWGGPPRSRAVEVITDPLDQRGVNARRVGPAL